MTKTAHAIGLLAIMLVAAWLRWSDLGVRPMHADEANQAIKLGDLLENGDYRFDPVDHHGPTLYYLGMVVARLRGETTLAGLSEVTVRVTPLLAGVAAVVLTILLAAPLGRPAALLAGLLVAVAPASVYYSRYFIQETLLAAFTLGTFVAAQRWAVTRHWAWAATAGGAAGLMLATKSSAPVFLLGGAGAAVLAGWRPAGPAGRGFFIFGAVALLVAGLFYSSFGSNWPGLRDALTTYGNMAGRVIDGSGHEKPWIYYAGIHLWHRAGGVLWDQSIFVAAAAVGAWLAWRGRGAPGQTTLRWAALLFALLFVAMSAVPYKTPWQVVNLVPLLAILTAGACVRIKWPAPAVVAALGVTLVLAQQTRQAVFRYPADARNPYAYVHTSPDLLRVTALAAAVPSGGVVRVIGREYWPLPWYLRRHAATGYWPAAPADCDGALVICTMDEAATVRARLRGRYQEGFLGLRPGVLLVTFIPTAAD